MPFGKITNRISGHTTSTGTRHNYTFLMSYDYGSLEYDTIDDYFYYLVGGNTDPNTRTSHWTSHVYKYSDIYIGDNEYGTLNIGWSSTLLDDKIDPKTYNFEEYTTLPIGKFISGSITLSSIIPDVNTNFFVSPIISNVNPQMLSTLSPYVVGIYDKNGKYLSDDIVTFKKDTTAAGTPYVLYVNPNYKHNQIPNDTLVVKVKSQKSLYANYVCWDSEVKINVPFITSVSVSPNGSQVTAGSTQTFRASVSNTGSISKILTWINKKFKKLKEYLNRKGEIKWKLVMPSYI